MKIFNFVNYDTIMDFEVFIFIEIVSIAIQRSKLVIPKFHKKSSQIYLAKMPTQFQEWQYSQTQRKKGSSLCFRAWKCL